MTTPTNALTEASRLLLSSLADAGVTDVVVSPGSRSTPLVVAAVREPRLTCHGIVDERSAAFFALGQSRIHGRPSVLVCTSGTALLHYFPAIAEAALTGSPLIVVSADRPHELQACHAPQTIDQIKVFGDYVRAAYDVPAPDGEPASLVGLRRLAMQAVAVSTGVNAGPVHLNFRARKPLEPRAPQTDADRLVTSTVDRLLARPIPRATRPTVVPSEDAVAAAVGTIARARRGVIVCGPRLVAAPDAAAAIARLSDATGFPVYAEATSQLRYGALASNTPRLARLDGVVQRLPDDRLPDLVVQVGLPSTFEVLPRLATRGVAPELVVLAESDHCDPSGTASVFVVGDVAASAGAIAARIGERAPSAGYPEDDAKVATIVARDLDGSPLTEGSAVRALLSCLGEDDVLVVGNSLAVRALDLYTEPGGAPRRVVSQRGASGIDGNVALAAGVAQASRSPTTLLLGDVTLLHDLGSFVRASSMTKNLRIVLLNNGGGRIFEQLPIASVPGLERDVLELTYTPHDTDFGKVAAAAGARHARVEDVASLEAVLRAKVAGIELVEVTLDADGASRQSRRIAEAIRSTR